MILVGLLQQLPEKGINMSLEIHCLFCGSPYACNNSTSKLVGPILETTCPTCRRELKKNFSSFLEEHVGGEECVFFPKIMMMIKLGRSIEGTINLESAYKRKANEE